MSTPRDPLRSQPFTPTTIQNANRTRGQLNQHASPAKSRIPRRIEPMSDGEISPFPPHPSIRPPPSVKASPRMPMGVGVAPRPTKAVPAAYRQDQATRLPDRNQAYNASSTAGDSSQDSQAQAAMHQPPPVPPQPSLSSRRYNMTQSYVSSVNEDTPPLRQQAPPRESHYPEDDMSPRPAYPSSKFMPQFEFPMPSNRDTMDTMDSYEQVSARAKPRMIDTSARPSTGPKPGEISPASTRQHAMNALSQAIAVGINKAASPRTFSPSGPVRMPFDNDATSVHTMDLEPPELKDAPPVPTSKLTAPEASTSPMSHSSESPILGLGLGAPTRGLSTKRGSTKRPPRLDIDAVREMEARGSTTSLTDLIKRATRLASNLDRGKTASRLGMLDMFGGSSSSQRLGDLGPGKRDSSMSDMLSSFPAPAAGTPRSEWPTEKGFMSSTTNLSRKKGDGSSSKQSKTSRRRICGMTVPCFTVTLIALILLVAAAVLIPIFLIVVPRQSSTIPTGAAASISSCSQADASRCQNSGTSIVTDGACGCVCSRGFTGKTCDIQGDSTCTTQDIADGSTVYRAATMSRSVLRAFNDAGRYNIPLNATTILGLFSTNGVTCADQGSLVNAGNGNSTSSNNNGNDKRAALADPEPLIMLPEFEPSEYHPLHLPQPTTAPTPTTLAIRRRQDASSSVPAPYSEVNGIVYDPSLDTIVTLASSTTSSASRTASSSAAANTAAPQSSTSSQGGEQLSFAPVVILYVAERSGSVAVSLDAKARLDRWFADINSANTVQLGQVAGQDIVVDMDALTLRDGGRTIGGRS
ncbi:uncharacterized protein HMPREF1541_00123 [Cyphellophora europaea CBS 101466]|uniref:EGF-like domain-containing protein n=1 Tax=Cyphellophora europaea (strain CBS 101466) TaxID=1220924 RepID=W2SB45_CYPE1|nr:uncharacterized protein HMPREF1541_00123 [Cyphellophora europaea CBS 101466]ETN45941.1 hypothetical protein HMPREF1541_00123 [Cyphellophora europaea CBS 101466]